MGARVATFLPTVPAFLLNWFRLCAVLCGVAGLLMQSMGSGMLANLVAQDHDGHHHTVHVSSVGGVVVVTLSHEHEASEVDDDHDHDNALPLGPSPSAHRHPHGDHVLMFGARETASWQQPLAVAKSLPCAVMPDGFGRERTRAWHRMLCVSECAARPPPLPPGWVRVVRMTVMVV